jgi:hypothetical protein
MPRTPAEKEVVERHGRRHDELRLLHLGRPDISYTPELVDVFSSAQPGAPRIAS